MRYLIMRSDITLDNIDKANSLETKRVAYEDGKRQFEEAMEKQSPYDSSGASDYETDNDAPELDSEGKRSGREIVNMLNKFAGLKLKPKFIRKKVIKKKK